MLVLLIVLLIVFLGYMVIPNYMARNRALEVMKKITNQDKKSIALTFDDGPDPSYTNRLLDILKENDVKATFFLVADKARKNRDIVERMKAEGHGIGMHSLYHKSAWLSLPHQTIKEFSKSLSIFSDLGLHITYFRPPWGTFNALTLRGALKHKLKVILWTVEAFDWRKDNTPAKIEQILLRRIEDKDIIVLHDSGGAIGAPENTLIALETTIPKLLKEGFHFVTVDEGLAGSQQRRIK